jgi:hypothetical protein
MPWAVKIVSCHCADLAWNPYLNGHPMTALGPPPVDNRSSRLGFHPGPEAVSPVALQVARLKCSFTHDVFPFVWACRGPEQSAVRGACWGLTVVLPVCSKRTEPSNNSRAARPFILVFFPNRHINHKPGPLSNKFKPLPAFESLAFRAINVVTIKTKT